VTTQALPCVEDCGGDIAPPEIFLLQPLSDVTVQYPTIEIAWCDNGALNASSRWIKVNGVLKTGSFSYTTSDLDCIGEERRSVSTSVALNVGANTIETHICDTANNCTTQTFTVTRVQPGAPTVTLHNHNGDHRARSLCLTVGAGEGAGLACGDLFVAHGLPAYRTMGRDRALTLFYTSGTAAPFPLVAAWVRQGASVQTPTSVFAQLTVNGAVRGSGTYYSWSRTAGARQVALAFNGSDLASGIYPFTLLVRNQYSSGTYDATVSGELLVVNRSQSEFGAGWWPAGIEQLVLGQSGGRLLWLGADGSAAVYDPAGTNLWVRAAGAFRDTIAYARNGRFGPYEYTRTLRHNVQVVFDASGRHVRTVNRLGHTTTFTWSGSPLRLTSIQVPPGIAGTTYTIAWEGGTNLIDYVSDPAGRALNATTTAGQLVALADPDGRSVQFQYDGSGRLTRRINRAGRGTRYEYANFMHVTRVRVPLSGAAGDSATTDFSWWDERGLALNLASGTLTAADSASVLTTIYGARPGVADDARFWVDRWGAPVRLRDALGQETQIARGDPANPALPTRVRSADGQVIGAIYNARGNLVAVSDSTHEGTGASAVATTSYVYGSSAVPDGPTEIRTPVDTTRIVYNATLRLPESVTAPGGHQTVFGYDANRLLASVTERQVRTVDTTQWTRFLLDQVTTFAYDAFGNDSVVTSPSGAQTRYERDGYRRVIRVFDPADHRTDHAYDVMNQDTAVTVWDGGQAFTTRYSYAVTGQILQVLDPRNVSRSWNYDYAGRPVVMFGEDSAGETRWFGPSGLLDSVRTRNGHVIRHTYDPNGQLLRTTYPAAANTFNIANHDATIPGDSILRTYDAVGRPVSIRRSTSTITNTYNREGSLRSQRQQVWNASGQLMSDFTARYWYDRGDRRTRFFNGTDTLRYTYGSDGQLDSLIVLWTTGQAPDRFRFFWDGLGRRDSVIYAVPNVHVTFGYDARGQLRMVCSRHPGNAAPEDHLEHQLLYPSMTADGMPLAIRRRAGSDQAGTACAQSLPTSLELTDVEYDGRHQMVRDQQYRYSYDASGNRASRRHLSNNVLRDSLEYLAFGNRIRHSRGDGTGGTGVVKLMTYDANGSLTEELPVYGVNTRLYYYNSLGELTGHKAYTQVGSDFLWVGAPEQCRYDALGRRVLACESGSWLGFDGDNVIRNGTSETAIWRYVHGPGLDDPLVGMYQISPGYYERYYYLTDGRGRQLAFTDAQGHDRTGTVTYTQNGGNQAGAIAASNGFENARAESPNTPQLSYYRNRYYDQQTGRWTQEDPIGIAGGVNLYAYAGNNPVSFSDPFGLCEKGRICRRYIYAHLASVDVVPGDTVARGDQLGLSGNTGRSSGPHLHYEVGTVDRNGVYTADRSGGPATDGCPLDSCENVSSRPAGNRCTTIDGETICRPHNGTDISVPRGTRVGAAASGVVVKSGWQNPANKREGYGLRVVVDRELPEPPKP
jgi:RHS repeat-associated protein